MAGAIDYPISRPDDIYGKPYGVLTSYTLFGETYPGAYANSVHASVGGQYGGMVHGLEIIIKAMTTAANNEEAREAALFQRYINLIPENTKLRKDFEVLINSKNYSQAFDTLIKTYSRMYDFNRTLKENQDIFNEINDLYLTRPFMYGLMDELGRSSHKGNSASYTATFEKIDLSMTGEQLINKIINGIEQQVINEKRLNEQELERYKKFLSAMRQFIQEIFIDSYGIDSLYNSLSDLENTKAIKSKRAKDKGKNANTPLNELIYNQISGLLNGKGLEVLIDFNGGVKTGDIKNKGQDIKTDDIILMTAEGSLVFADNPTLKQDVKNITEKYELDDFLLRGAFEDNFIIMTSAKDQSISADFNNKFSAANTTIKFAEPARLTQRIADIRQFGEVSGTNVDDLIFALVNLASDLVCAGEEGMVRQALGTLCINWMFDDIGELIINVPMSNSAQKICVYNVSGRYYTLSDILKTTIAKIKGKTATDLIKINLKIPASSSYNSIAQTTKEGTPRWDAVRNYIVSNTRLGFELRAKNLFEAFY